MRAGTPIGTTFILRTQRVHPGRFWPKPTLRYAPDWTA